MSWQPINLARLEGRPPVTPTVGGVGLVYPGKRHVVSGPPESAKTLAAYAIGIEEVRAKGTVVLIDFEMGRWDARDRLREMGATDDDLERIIYIEPDSPATEPIVAELLSFSPTLVIIDAAAGAYDLQGMDDNKRGDAERFARTFIHPFWVAGIATIVLDHVVKNAKNRGGFTIGSERKTGGADVHLSFETVLPISRGGRGLYRITTHKDRGGHLKRPRAAELELLSDPVTNAISWTFQPASDDTSSDGFRPTVLMQYVSEYIELNQPVSRNLVEKNVKGRSTTWKRAAIDILVAEGYLSERPGPRNSRMLSSLRAFPDLTSPDLAPTSPGEDTTDLASSPSASRRGEDEVEVEVGRVRLLPGDDGYFEWLFATLEEEHITEGEWHELTSAHRLVERGAA